MEEEQKRSETANNLNTIKLELEIMKLDQQNIHGFKTIRKLQEQNVKSTKKQEDKINKL